MKKELTLTECQSVSGGIGLFTALVGAPIVVKVIEWAFNKVVDEKSKKNSDQGQGRCNCYNENNKMIQSTDFLYASECAAWCCTAENKNGRWTLFGSSKDNGSGSC